ncbi:MAG: methyltransferase domain-containing protein [Anaerolineae bacterium]
MTWLGRLYMWATHRLYDELAWAYDVVSWCVSLGRWSSWRRAALDQVVGRRILELGFGTGELLSEMAERGWDLVGLDASVAMHRVTGRKLARSGIDIPRVRGVTQCIPFANQSFDTAVCTFPAEYILHPATLHEVARVLRGPDPVSGEGGGRLVMVGLTIEVDLPFWRRSMGFLFGRQDASALERFGYLAHAAGLRMKVVEMDRGRVRVPVVIAKRTLD